MKDKFEKDFGYLLNKLLKNPKSKKNKELMKNFDKKYEKYRRKK